MNETNTGSGAWLPGSFLANIQQLRKRKQYINNKTLQLQIVKHLTVIAVIGGILALNSLYIYKSLVPLPKDGTTLLDFSSGNILIWGFAFLSLAMNGLLFLVVAILYSHRLIGPHEKIVATLQQIAQGDLQRTIRLRSTDHLQEIGNAVNQVISSHSHSISDLSQAVRSLKDHQQLDGQEIDRQLVAMEAILNRYAIAQEKGGNDAT
jgi:methyl-accepting chemotaxis protein